MTPMIDVYIRLTDAEQRALRRHLSRIDVGDKHKRVRAMREYRRFLDYLEAVGRITYAERLRLELFRLNRDHKEMPADEELKEDEQLTFISVGR